MKFRTLKKLIRKKNASRRKLRLRLALAAGGITAIIGAMSAFTVCRVKQNFGRGGYPDRRFSNQKRYDPDYRSTHSRAEVRFRSGKNTLHGFIYGMENTAPKGLLVFAHGITVGHESYINQLMWFADHNWRVFAYDATGSAASEGAGTVGLVQSALDLDKALSYAETDDRLKDLPIYLLGHSWGGYAVCAVLNFGHNSRIRAAASLSGYADPNEMMMLGTERNVGKAGARIFAPYVNGYNISKFGKNWKLSAIDGINRSGLPVLVIHGEHDDYVDINKVSIYSKREKITNPKAKFYLLRGKYADHFSFFKNDAANDYLQEFYRRRDALMAEYGGNIPDSLHERFVRSFNKRMINSINTNLLELIEKFYNRAAEKEEPSE